MTTPNLDEAVDTHLALIQFFRDGHCTTTEEIAARYRIGRRTAQRYLIRVNRYVPLTDGPNYRRRALR